MREDLNPFGSLPATVDHLKGLADSPEEMREALRVLFERPGYFLPVRHTIDIVRQVDDSRVVKAGLQDLLYRAPGSVRIRSKVQHLLDCERIKRLLGDQYAAYAEDLAAVSVRQVRAVPCPSGAWELP